MRPPRGVAPHACGLDRCTLWFAMPRARVRPPTAAVPARQAAHGKEDFELDEVVRRLRDAVRPFRTAALFELAEEGYRTPFEQLVACILSIRTRDETTVVAARRLFSVARTPEAVLRSPLAELDALIAPCTFHENKARQIRAIARRVVDELGGALPCDAELLMSLPGVGPKCANLVLGIACGVPRIGVDIHVHRVTNRWGYVATRTPEQTMVALEAQLPRVYWVEINRLLVPFGKHVCTGVMPRCSTCPVRGFCRQVGVTSHR
jgi:endonuclease III